MNPWNLDVNFKLVVLDMLYLSSFIILGTILRRYIKIFQKYLIPNNLIAGFLALLIGSQGLGLLNLESERLIAYLYHLLALTFITLGLRQKKSKWTKGPVSKALASLSSYLLQGIIGLSIALVLYYTVLPDIFVGIGLVVPLGFGMGPGLAATIAGSWEKWGFVGGAQIGLTFATIGYLYAFIVGMALIQWGIKNRKTALIDSMDHITAAMRTGVIKTGIFPEAGRLPMATEAIEPLTFHIALIGFIYLMTFLLIKAITDFLISIGASGFVSTIWGFHFIFGLLISIFVRTVLDKTNRAYLIDTGLMTRTMGLFLDFLVVGAVAGISLAVVLHYWLPITLMALIAGPATLFMLYWICKRAFDDYHFERFLELFGEMTGTINSALVLLKVVDPEFKTPVAEDAVYGGVFSLALGFPLLIALNIPFVYFQNSIVGYWVTLGVLFGYWLLLIVIWRSFCWIHFSKTSGNL